MIQHKFVSSWANFSVLSYEITFLKAGWRKSKSEQFVFLPAPVLFNLDNIEGWSLTEEELDTYLGELPQVCIEFFLGE